jgi:hypothetical protein
LLSYSSYILIFLFFVKINLISIYIIRGEKKTKKLIKPRKQKNNRKNQTVKKNWLKFWKNRPVRFGFGFITLKLKKPNRTQTGKKPSQTGLNRFCHKKTEPKQVGLNRFRFFLDLLLKKIYQNLIKVFQIRERYRF